MAIRSGGNKILGSVVQFYECFVEFLDPKCEQNKLLNTCAKVLIIAIK